jgi:hypothetical protein
VSIAILVGLLGGSALADELILQDLVPAGLATTRDGTPAPSRQPAFPTNEAGQTFGSPDESVLPKDWPNLILVQASNGAAGYVEKAVLDELTGANVSNPAEAVAWQAAMDKATWDTIEIPVYLSDGETVVGGFPVTRSQPTALP